MHPRVTKFPQITYVIAIPEETTGNKGECLKPPRNKRHQATNPRFSKSKTRQWYSFHSKATLESNSDIKTPQERTDKQGTARRLPRGKGCCREQARKHADAFTHTQPEAAASPSGKLKGGRQEITLYNKTSSKGEVSQDFCFPSVSFFSFFLFSLFLFFGEGKVRITCQHSYAKNIKGSSLANGINLDRRASVEQK